MSWSVSILTPGRQVYVGPAASVTLPTQLGELTLLPDHVPLMGLVVAGHLEVRPEAPAAPGGAGDGPASRARFAIGPGGLEITQAGVVVMVESATADALVDAPGSAAPPH